MVEGILTGLDKAIIGVASIAGDNPVVVYDQNKIIEQLMSINDWDITEAREYYYFNIHTLYIGKDTPLIMESIDELAD